ncbi:MAG TPA: 3-dehydroquinate synthase [Gemmatimonadaceae bacterium]|jgi:3-dehydroquinate synthase|nr:3-dehydroquinate synthase [Gemmatimonadaceae bacterium]
MPELGYPIEVKPGSLKDLGDFARGVAPTHRYAIITDTNVGPLYGSAAGESLGIDTNDCLVIPAGENSKTRGTWGWITDQLIDRGFGRDSAIVALGGGVIGDLAGFVAATYMRGVPVVHVPTTLLAMIDASIGGKTGVDTQAGKNLVGSFHPPAGVLADPQLLSTLPLRELRTGFAEALKHGAIADRRYFDSVVSAIPRVLFGPGEAGDSLTGVIVGSIEIKSGIVARDVHEGGVRKILNFGHTIGHAIEMLSEYSLAHGEAVAIGMTLESTVAERCGIAEKGTADEVRSALVAAGLPVEMPEDMDADRILEVMRSDKKARAGEIQYALPSRIGEMAGADSGWTVSVAESIVREVLT